MDLIFPKPSVDSDGSHIGIQMRRIVGFTLPQEEKTNQNISRASSEISPRPVITPIRPLSANKVVEIPVSTSPKMTVSKTQVSDLTATAGLKKTVSPPLKNAGRTIERHTISPAVRCPRSQSPTSRIVGFEISNTEEMLKASLAPLSSSQRSFLSENLQTDRDSSGSVPPHSPYSSLNAETSDDVQNSAPSKMTDEFQKFVTHLLGNKPGVQKRLEQLKAMGNPLDPLDALEFLAQPMFSDPRFLGRALEA